MFCFRGVGLSHQSSTLPIFRCSPLILTCHLLLYRTNFTPRGSVWFLEKNERWLVESIIHLDRNERLQSQAVPK